MRPKLGDKRDTFLYKYRPDNDHTLQMLKNQELYFSFPRDFNDPFDCRILVDFSGGDDNGLRALAKKHRIPEPLLQGALEGLRSIDFDANEIEQKYSKTNFDTYIIYCISEVRDNIQMWSHYAKSHRGICVGFETAIQDNLLFIKIDDPKHYPNDLLSRGLLPIFKVEYSDKCPEPYKYFDDSEHLLTFLQTKAESWRYEQEHRIILPYGEINRNIIRFDKSALKELLLGCNIQDKFRQQVLELIANEYLSNGYSVDVFQSHLSTSRYELDIEKIGAF